MNDIKVIITQNKAAGLSGFGIPLILAGKQQADIPYTTCSDIDSVKLLFPELTPIYKAASLIFMQENAPAEIAVCASTQTAVVALGGIFELDWRQLIVVSLDIEEESTAVEISTFIEARNDKLFFTSSPALISNPALKTMERTVSFHHRVNLNNPVCALIGATAGKKPGSFTYKNQKLKGVEPAAIPDSEVKLLHESGGITVLKKAGDIVSSEGFTTNGEYIDIVDTRDYIIKDLEYRIQKLLNSADKIPFDNNGIAMLESVALTVLKEAYNNGMIAVNDKGLPDFAVSFAKRSETSPADRAKRQYLGGKFRFGLAGAVHTVEIRGEIIV